MERYRYLPHTADAMFQAFGKDLEEAFSNAALAMFNIITDTSLVRKRSRRGFRIASKTRESLLYDFLEEFLFLLDSEGLVLSEIISLSIKEGFDLMCEFYCDKADGYDFKGDIKSITYNNMSISEEPGKVTIQAVVDI